MDFTEIGIVTLVSPVQLRNAPSAMVSVEEGIVILVRPVQPEKAHTPIFVTEEGIVMLVSPAQSWNAPSPMLVTFFSPIVDGIVSAPACEGLLYAVISTPSSYCLYS